MRILSVRTLREFWMRHPNAEPALREWVVVVRRAEWDRPVSAVQGFRGVTVLDANTLIFKRLGGNKFRLVASVDWGKQILYVKFIGTHAEYDKTDIEALVYKR